MSGWLHVVGIGAGGLDTLAGPARTLIETADLLVGGERHLSMVANDSARKLAWSFPLDGIVATLREAKSQRVVVLATGDPMSFGIGSTLARHFEPEDLILSRPPARSVWPLPGSPGPCMAVCA